MGEESDGGEEWGIGEEGISSGCGPVSSGGKRGTGTWDIGCSSGLGSDRNDRLDDNRNEYMEGELAHYLQSTMIQVVGGFVLSQM